jgi:hypothetical protein
MAARAVAAPLGAAQDYPLLNLGCVNDLGQFLGLLIRQRWLLDGGR